MNQGSLFQPLGGLLSRFDRGGSEPLYVRACPALQLPRYPAHAAPFVADSRLAWAYLWSVSTRLGVPW